MNVLKFIFISILFLGGPCLLSTIAWCSCNEDNLQANITLLRNAASALTQSRPDLSKALSDYADAKTKGDQVMGISAELIISETDKVKAIASQLGNAILTKNSDTLEGLMYSNPSVAFNGTRKHSWEMIKDYHDSAKSHELLNFDIANVKFSDDLSEAGVVVKEFFAAKDGVTVQATEGWTFRKESPSNEWRFVGIAFSSEDRK